MPRKAAPSASQAARKAATTEPVVRFETVLGGNAPTALRVTAHGVASGAPAPLLRITAEPIAPPLDPPGASWVAALRAGRVPADGRALLRRSIDLGLAYELARRYRTFLANPDLDGPARATYVFASSRVAAPSAAPAASASSDEGIGALGLAALAAGLLLAAAAAAVAWSHL